MALVSTPIPLPQRCGRKPGVHKHLCNSIMSFNRMPWPARRKRRSFAAIEAALAGQTFFA
jgi:hypothetical protein